MEGVDIEIDSPYSKSIGEAFVNVLLKTADIYMQKNKPVV